MKSALLKLALIAVSTVCALNTRSADSAAAPAATMRGNYARPFELRTRPAFLPLPPGAVEPVRWLRDWCLAARDGFTGHRDEYEAEFKRAWSPDHKMIGEGLLWCKGAWPYEGGGYWFDGLARLGFALHDEALIQQAKMRLYAVADPMNTNGLLFLWWLDRNNSADRKAVTAALEGWPLWACGLLGHAMTGFYAGSGGHHILEALEKAYIPDLDCLRFIEDNMSNPWPAFDTYSWTGNPGIAAALDAIFKQEGTGLAAHQNFAAFPVYVLPGDPSRLGMKPQPTKCKKFHQITNTISMTAALGSNVRHQVLGLGRLRQTQFVLLNSHASQFGSGVFKSDPGFRLVRLDPNINYLPKCANGIVKIVTGNLIAQTSSPIAAGWLRDFFKT